MRPADIQAETLRPVAQVSTTLDVKLFHSQITVTHGERVVQGLIDCFTSVLHGNNLFYRFLGSSIIRPISSQSHLRSALSNVDSFFTQRQQVVQYGRCSGSRFVDLVSHFVINGEDDSQLTETDAGLTVVVTQHSDLVSHVGNFTVEDADVAPQVLHRVLFQRYRQSTFQRYAQFTELCHGWGYALASVISAFQASGLELEAVVTTGYSVDQSNSSVQFLMTHVDRSGQFVSLSLDDRHVLLNSDTVFHVFLRSQFVSFNHQGLQQIDVLLLVLQVLQCHAQCCAQCLITHLYHPYEFAIWI